MTNLATSSESTLSIGALSKATGVPVETLRTWERRYGYPSPERTAGGHRLYTPDHVEQLALITDALERGHRPGSILISSRAELVELLGLSNSAERDQSSEVMQSLPVDIESWLEAVRALDERLLDMSLRSAWDQLGGMRFLEDRVAPFLAAIGHLWATDSLTVLHEHFASEHVRDFLTSKWRQLSDRAVGANVFCTTLPGEEHSLGLHMAATTLALSGARVQYFGINTPIDSIINGVDQAEPCAVVFSVSAAADDRQVSHDLRYLRQRIPSRVQLVTGGSGAREDIPGVLAIRDLSELRQWAADSM